MGCCGIAQKFDMTSTPLREICECYGPDSVEIKARPRAFIQLWTGASGSMCDATYTHSSDAFRWADVSIEDCSVLLYHPKVLKLCLFLSCLSRLGLILDSVNSDGLSILVGQSELATACTELC